MQVDEATGNGVVGEGCFQLDRSVWKLREAINKQKGFIAEALATTL